jgi:hypothetical protein
MIVREARAFSGPQSLVGFPFDDKRPVHAKPACFAANGSLSAFHEDLDYRNRQKISAPTERTS